MKKKLYIAAYLLIGLCLLLYGQSTLTLTAPSPPSVGSVSATRIGNQGNTTTYYWVVANWPIGQSAATGIQVLFVPDTLTGSNYIRLNWNLISGVTSYDVLKTSTPQLPASCTCAVATGLTVGTVNDIGGALGAYTYTPVGAATSTITLNNSSQSAPLVSADRSWHFGRNVEIGTTCPNNAPTNSLCVGTGSAGFYSGNGLGHFTVPDGLVGAYTILLSGIASFSDLTGTITADQIPLPSATTVGGVKTVDCTGTGHILKINADGSSTCSADAGGGGGGATLSAGLGWTCTSMYNCFGGNTVSWTPAANTTYFQQFIVLAGSTTVKQYVTSVNVAAAAYYAFAIMDNTCTKVAGSDINWHSTTGSQWTQTAQLSVPITLNAGVYYMAYGTDTSQAGGFLSPANTTPDFNNFGTYDGNAGTGASLRIFTGSALTGAAGTLAVPGTCGSKVNALSNKSVDLVLWP